MAKRLNRFDKEKEIKLEEKTIEEKKEEVIENTASYDVTLENTTELPILDIAEFSKEEDEAPTYVKESRHMHFKAVIIFLLSILVIASLLLAGYILLKPVEKEESIQASSYATPIAFDDGEKQQMLDSINNYLYSLYGAEYSVPSIDGFTPSGNENSACIDDFRVTLTTASNSPTLITRFSLSYNAETNSYDVVDYLIRDTEYPVSENAEVAPEN